MATIFDKVVGGAFSTAFRVVRPMTKAGLNFTWAAAKGTGQVAYRAAPDLVRGGMWYSSRTAKTLMSHPKGILGLSAVAGVAAMGEDASSYGKGSLSSRNQELMARYYGRPSTGFEAGMGATRKGLMFNQFENGPGATRAAFMQSAEGLTLGLHQGRHR